MDGSVQANAGNRQPAGLPSWPSWRRSDGGRTCIVSGRHLTPARARLAQLMASCITLALLVFVGWYYWGFKNLPPDWLRIGINAAGKQFGHIFNFEQRKWIYVGLWVCCWLLFRFWRRMIVWVLYPPLRKRSTVRFTTGTITLPRALGRRARVYPRGGVEPITFVLQGDPKLAKRLLKPHSPERSLFLHQAQFLFLQYGRDLVLVARFAIPQDADRFLQVCLFSNGYRLKSQDTSKPQRKVYRDV